MKTNWQTKKLGEVCEMINRGVSPKYIETDGLCVLNQKCIRDHEINFDLSRLHDYKNKKVSSDRLIQIGDVLVNSTGTGTLGRVAQVRELSVRATVDSHITIIRPIKNMFYNDFFGYALIFIENEIAKRGDGCGGQTELARNTLKNDFKISYPESITEQKVIVKKLDEVFGNIEKARENAEKNLKNSKELFESYLRNIFEKAGDDWEEKTLDAIADVEYGHTDKARAVGDYRYVRITDTDKNGLLTETNKLYIKIFKEKDKFILNQGDLLMARVGASFGNVLFFESEEPSIFASYLIRIKFGKEMASKLYWYFSKSKLYWDQVKKLSSGSAQPQFNGGALKQIVFNYPKDLSKQKAIVKKLDALAGETKKLEAIYKQKLADLEELKKSVLKSAFAGKL